MKAIAQTLELVDDPERIAEYERAHERVWPEVLRALRAIGIQRMRIFRHSNRLFMYCEVPDDFDPRRDYQAYAADPRCREWDQSMRRYQQQVPRADSASWWTPMEAIFDLEAQERS
ncbi:MAG: L-rhamnose mutarotase [Planctomycetes bacterium]|nr:L-rhamnose mutarotase [Planctomycetota bacterium]